MSRRQTPVRSTAVVAAVVGLAGVRVLVLGPEARLDGIGAEVALRGPPVDFTSAATTAAAIRGAGLTFPLAIAADVVMAVADAALAILLFVLFRPVATTLALAAMVFRLIQSVLIAANLMNMLAAWLLLTGGQDLGGLGGADVEAMALTFLNLHAHGYDLGLVFFAIKIIFP